MKKIVWLSRHELTTEQKAYWEKNVPDAEFVTENVTWANSESEDGDWRANNAIWERIISQYKPIAILGVFPPVALECLRGGHKIPIYSPISKQNAKVREDGTRQIEFIHLRWSMNLNPNR